MKYSLLKWILALWVAFTFTSCSLLKVSVATGDPLKKEDVNTRIMTRGFYYDMAAEVTKTADSIVTSASDPQTKLNAIQWKIRATRASVAAAMQSIPEVSLADMWILCRQMDEIFAKTPDASLFGRYSPLARATTARIDDKVERLAKTVLSPKRFELMSGFVTKYLKDNPLTDAELTPANTTLAWLDYLKANGVEHAYVSGSISEVLADMGDRVSGHTQQISNTVGWSKDMIEIRMGQDSLRSRMEMQLDSLEGDLRRMAMAMETVPGISEALINSFNKQAKQLIGAMNYNVGQVFMNIDTQRDELQQFISAERQAVITDARLAANETVQNALGAIPNMIARLMFYIVLFAVVMIGLPFGIGIWLGGARERSRQRKKEKTSI
ncbi:MAG: hypothetical protein RR330_06060 [Alistipes sp.]